MFIRLSVEISDDRYSYGKRAGAVNIEMEIPALALQNLDIALLLPGMAEAALQNYNEWVDPKEVEGIEV